MAMTIDAWQKELHHEQIVLDKIIAALIWAAMAFDKILRSFTYMCE